AGLRSLQRPAALLASARSRRAAGAEHLDLLRRIGGHASLAGIHRQHGRTARGSARGDRGGWAARAGRIRDGAGRSHEVVGAARGGLLVCHLLGGRSAEMTPLEKWAKEAYAKSAGKPGALRKALFQTSSGIEVTPLYSPEEPPEKLGFPGAYPFTRGVQPTMYRGRFWTMRQYAGFGSAEQTNQRFHYLLKSGQTGLSTAFDLPTQMGHDSDSPRARGEVGRVGVAIDSVDDMERLFKGIDLGKVSTSMTINATAATLLALYQAVGEAHGTGPAALSGTIQNDVLKEYMAR